MLIIGRHTDTQAERKIDRPKTDRERHTYIDTYIHRRNTETDRQTDIQTDRQTDR